MANRGNATLRAIGEFWYLASRAWAIAIEDGAAAVRDGLASKFKAKKLDHVHVPGELCARCITARQRSRVRAVEEVTHWIDTAVRLFAYAAMLVGGFIAGIAAMTMSLFPSSTRPSTPQVKTGGNGGGSGKDNDDHERGDGRDSTDDSDDNNDNDSPASFKREADPDFWDSYNKNVSELNSMAIPPVWDVHNDIHKDDHLVKELNSMARAVEDGKEDPRKLQQVAEELYKHEKIKTGKTRNGTC